MDLGAKDIERLEAIIHVSKGMVQVKGKHRDTGGM